MPDNKCLSCEEDRKKKGLPPMERVVLPAAITDAENFKKPALVTIVCSYCDGETLISSALKSYQARQAQ